MWKWRLIVDTFPFHPLRMLQFFHCLVQTDPLLRLPVTLNASLPVSFFSGNTDLAPGAKEQLDLSCFRTTACCFPCKCCGWLPQFVSCLHQFCNPSVCRRAGSSTLQTGQPAACFYLVLFLWLSSEQACHSAFFFSCVWQQFVHRSSGVFCARCHLPTSFHRAGLQTKGPGMVWVYEKHNTEGEDLKISVL